MNLSVKSQISECFHLKILVYVFSRHRYFTIVTDPVNHCVYDVITDGRAKKHIEYWFQERKEMLSKVEKATMDMSASY